MAKTVFDVLVQKFDDDISSATQFLVGGLLKTSQVTRKLLA